MAAPVSSGDVLAGKYKVDRVLGEGGMGVVVAAQDVQLERKVAIKFLLPAYAQHHEAAQRFLREARAAVKIHSEHVARVIDVATMENGSPYMVMEYLEGSDLSALGNGGRVSLEDAVGYVLEACDAIAEAHSVGIVHRDLKPANLFLARQPDGSSKVKVLDFGISKAMVTSTGMDPSLTRTSSLMGSPLYMSPEQMKSAKNVDPRTDIWALGAILYELLTGNPPFYAESIPELSAKVLLEEPTPIRAHRPDVPEAVEAAVKRALAKDPAARFPTVADFAQALAAFGPPRTRANVERASRVLHVSTASLVRTEVPATEPMPQAATARTAGAWVGSSAENAAPEPKKKSGALVGGAIAAAVVVLGGAFFAFSGNKAPAAPGAGSTLTGAQPAAPPVTAAPEPPKPAAPASAAPAESAVAVAPVVAPSTAAAPSAAADPVAPSHPVKPVAQHPKLAPKPPAKPAAASPPKPEDPFDRFGSRK